MKWPRIGKYIKIKNLNSGMAYWGGMNPHRKLITMEIGLNKRDAAIGLFQISIRVTAFPR